MTTTATARDSIARKAGYLAFGAALLALASGCHQEKLCAALGDCGGDFLGNWALGPGHESCAEDVTAFPADPRLRGGDVPPQRIPAPEQAFSNWCQGLIAGTENVLAVPPTFFSDSMPFGSAVVRYHADGTYSIGIGRIGYFYFEFSAECMHQFGFGQGLATADICAQLQAPLAASGAGEGSYRNTTCTVNPKDPGGCYCVFDVAEISGSGGSYRQVAANELLHFPNTPGVSFRTSFCRTGSKLQITGADGGYLLNRPALRTLDLGQVNCTDGLQGIGEDGVDCGPACDVVCPGATPPAP
ncbi:MAG TPA: hypothetical protein VN755_09825 [Steroidobacteraceae bacterium]|nr:hypothetical protein [Steroidobacteraceae bacterium]